MLVCCLLALAVPTTAKAADPALDDLVCAVQSVNNPPLPPTWQIKGTASVKDIPAGYLSVKVTVKFEKRANANGAWGTVSEVNQTVGVSGGTATIDTGFQTLPAPAPASGNQYRIMVSGTVIASPPNQSIPLIPKGSLPITPVP